MKTTLFDMNVPAHGACSQVNNTPGTIIPIPIRATHGIM